MKARISPLFQTLLRQQPPATPVLVRLEKPSETALAMRVNDLFSFRRQGIPITVRPIGYQGKEGTWVVAVVFRVVGSPTAPVEGAAYVNPRKEEDFRLLQQLTIQEHLPFLFLSPQLKVAVGQEARWSIHHRQEVRLLLAQIGHTATSPECIGDEDADFESVRQEFERLYAVKNLLVVRTPSEVRGLSSFRGVVLD